MMYSFTFVVSPLALEIHHVYRNRTFDISVFLSAVTIYSIFASPKYLDNTRGGGGGRGEEQK